MFGGSTLSIGVTMFLRDQFSGPAQRIKASTRSLEEDFQRMQEANLRHQRNMYTGLAFAGAMALRGIGRNVKRAAEWSYEMKFVQSITTATADEQKRLENIAKRLGRETMFYPQAVAEGMRFMAMAGMSAQEVEKNIEGAVKLAGATKSELGGKGGAADIMTNVMKQFKVGFEYTNDVADVLAYAVTRANTNLFDLGEALKYAGSTSMDLSISLNESTAMVMALGNAGLQGSMAGVAMENSMRYLSRAFSSFSSGPSRRALAELGMDVSDVTDQNGNLLSMVEVIKRIGQAVDQNFGQGMNLEKQGVLQSIFGVRGKRAGSLFIRNLQEFEKFTNDISVQSAGHSTKVMTDMMDTLQGTFYRVGSSIQAMWQSFTQKIEPSLKAVLKVLLVIINFVERVFNTPFLGGFLTHAISGFLILKTATFAYRAVVAGLALIHGSVGISSISMGANMVTSWNAGTAAAQRYKFAAMSAMTGNMAPMVGMGKVKGLATNKAGRIISPKTGRFVSNVGAASVASGASRMVGGKVVARTLLSRVAGGLFGGPVGLALAFVLPGLIGIVIDAIKGSKTATEKNTKTLEEAERARIRENLRYTRMGHMIQVTDGKAPDARAIMTSDSDKGSTIQENILYKLDRLLEKQLEEKSVQPINIYIDNEKQVEKLIRKNEENSTQLF